jgi:hypothetical protein
MHEDLSQSEPRDNDAAERLADPDLTLETPRVGDERSPRRGEFGRTIEPKWGRRGRRARFELARRSERAEALAKLGSQPMLLPARIEIGDGIPPESSDRSIRDEERTDKRDETRSPANHGPA